MRTRNVSTGANGVAKKTSVIVPAGTIITQVTGIVTQEDLATYLILHMGHCPHLGAATVPQARFVADFRAARVPAARQERNGGSNFRLLAFEVRGDELNFLLEQKVNNGPVLRAANVSVNRQNLAAWFRMKSSAQTQAPTLLHPAVMVSLHMADVFADNAASAESKSENSESEVDLNAAARIASPLTSAPRSMGANA